jgi:hypothetical protein
MNIPRMSILAALLAATLVAPQALAQQAYPKPEDAAQALVDALGTQKADAAKLTQVLGAQWRTFVPTEVERDDVDAFLAGYKSKHSLRNDAADRVSLVVGPNDWSFPIPIIKGADGWRFDLKGGAQEIRERRIGRNELAAVESERAYHDAQTEYAQNDRDDDGVLEYAQKVFSTDGLHDGLYWADDDSGEISPLGPLFGGAADAEDWHGYHFRILTAQGPSAPGGAYNYMLGKDMSRGFALVGWPAKYGDTGVMSFMISHDGQVFEKDLGPNGAATAKAMKAFDPDSSWEEVKDTAAAPSASR